MSDNKDYWRSMLPIITAYCEGKTVQYRLAKHGNTWTDVDGVLGLFCPPCDFRIKPTDQWRAFQPDDPIPGFVMVRGKYTNSNPLTTRIFMHNETSRSFTDTQSSSTFSYDFCFTHFFIVLPSGDTTPFGVKIESPAPDIRQTTNTGYYP